MPLLAHLGWPPRFFSSADQAGSGLPRLPLPAPTPLPLPSVPPPPPPPPQPLAKRLLLHTVGHRDLILVVEAEDSKQPWLVLPKASASRQVSLWLRDQILSSKDLLQAMFPLRPTLGPSEPEPKAAALRLEEVPVLDASSLPIGWRFGETLVLPEEIRQFLEPKSGKPRPSRLWGVYLPVFSSVLAKFREQWTAPDSDEGEKATPTTPEKRFEGLVLLLGTDQDDPRWEGTDTQHTAEILKEFTRWTEAAFPETRDLRPPFEVGLLEPLSSSPHLYGPIMEYVHRWLQPYIDEICKPLYKEWKDQWKKALSIGLSVNTGTQPMTFGLHLALRAYNPDIYYVAKARSYLTELRALECIHHHPTEVDQTYKVSRDQVEGVRKELVDRMERWKARFPWDGESKEGGTSEEGQELRAFWYRKSRQPVLAILAIRRPDGYEWIESCNLEVSMPTGSLCAERNGIGTALSRWPDLRREDVVAVAVLSLVKGNNPLWPCGACMEWLQKIHEVNPTFEVLSFSSRTLSEVYIRRFSL